MKSLFFLKLFFIYIITNVNLYADNLDNRNFIYVKEYLNNLNSLEADFLQVSSDGDMVATVPTPEDVCFVDVVVDNPPEYSI